MRFWKNMNPARCLPRTRNLTGTVKKSTSVLNKHCTRWMLRGGIGLCLLPLASCNSAIEYGEIPVEDIHVNFIVRPYSMDNELLAIGNYKEFPDQGDWGVLVYHIGYMDEDYVAFNQACPFDCESSGCYVQYDKSKEAFIGSVCKQEFSTYTGFCTTVSGYGLVKYNITYYPDGSFLVSN